MKFRSARIEALLAGPAPSDPLYVSNQSLVDRLKPWLIVGAPCLALLLASGIAISHIQKVRQSDAIVSRAKIAAMVLPPSAPRPLNVFELRIDASGERKLIGAVRNVTDHVIVAGHLQIELDDAYGQPVGSAVQEVSQVPPGGIVHFQIPVPEPDASVAMVVGMSVR